MPTNKKKITRQEEDKAKFTHDAYIFKCEGIRKGRRVGYWEREGYSRIEPDGSLTTYLHSTPIGGFDGRIKSRLYDTAPPDDENGDEEPERPGDAPDDGD